MAGEDVSLATKRRRADGSLVDVWIVFSPMRAWLDGPVDGWLAVVRDATQERAVQRELRRRVELVGRLASVVASLNSDLDLHDRAAAHQRVGPRAAGRPMARPTWCSRATTCVIAAVSGLESSARR